MGEFFTKYFLPYWTQILVFIGVIGYFFQRLFENKDKRSFKRFEMFQEKKLASELEFLKQSQKFLDSYISTVYSNKGSYIDREKEFTTVYKNLQEAYADVKTFLSETDAQPFDDAGKCFFHVLESVLSVAVDVVIHDNIYESEKFKESSAKELNKIKEAMAKLRKAIFSSYDS